MPRAYRHLTWRVIPRAFVGGGLQTLQRDSKSKLRWVTLARGNRVDLEPIAEALNRARFTLFDIRPARTEKQR